MLAPPDEAAPAGPVPCERLAAWCTLQPTGSTQTSLVRATSWPRRRPAGHRQNRRRAFLRCLVSTHGDELRSWVHPWRWLRFSSPPKAPFLQLRGRRAVMARSGVRDPRPGHFSTHGDDLPSRLHLWRRFWISPPPMAIVLVLHCRGGANIARSCIRDSGHGHFSTHGDDLPSRLHLWRRFGISPPPTATFPQRRWEKEPFADDSAAPTDDGTHAVAKDKLMRTAFKALHGRRRQGRRRRRRQGRRRRRRQ